MIDNELEILNEFNNDEEKLKILNVYLDNPENKPYYIGSEICELLEYKNTTQSIKLNVSEHNKISFKNYSGKKNLN